MLHGQLSDERSLLRKALHPGPLRPIGPELKTSWAKGPLQGPDRQAVEKGRRESELRKTLSD